MFERFTDRARRVIVLAQEEARMLGHNYIGTEHILLGVIHEGGGVSGAALDTLGVTLDGAREQVASIVSPGKEALSGHIPFTPRAKTVLELSLREALNLGHSNIGPEDVLLGLIREGGGVASVVLLNLGVSGDRAWETVLGLLRERGEGGPGREGEAGGAREAGAARQRPPSRPAGPQVVGTPLQLAGILSRLGDIIERLDAIERHLGIGPQQPASEPEPGARPEDALEPGPPEQPGPPEAPGKSGEAGPAAG
jgi:ATP-dependent Clp protease ATP-binding subunit ClpC